MLPAQCTVLQAQHMISIAMMPQAAAHMHALQAGSAQQRACLSFRMLPTLMPQLHSSSAPCWTSSSSSAQVMLTHMAAMRHLKHRHLKVSRGNAVAGRLQSIWHDCGLRGNRSGHCISIFIGAVVNCSWKMLCAIPSRVHFGWQMQASNLLCHLCRPHRSLTAAAPAGLRFAHLLPAGHILVKTAQALKQQHEFQAALAAATPRPTRQTHARVPPLELHQQDDQQGLLPTGVSLPMP
jgi:hypothetical protein